MAATAHKTSTKSRPGSVDVADIGATLADEYGQIDAQIKALTKKKDDVAVRLRDLVPASTPVDESVSFAGRKFEVAVGKVPYSEEVVDKVRVREILGDETFMEIAKISITDARDYLTPKQREEVVSGEFKGVRRITCKALPGGRRG